jgi:hypothetical protein
VLFRGLPSIIGCGLWDAVRSRPPAPTYALITDVGNDIPFGAPVPAIASWVEVCLDRLDALGSRTTVTLLPERSIEALSPFLFSVARTVLFPRCRLGREEVIERVHALNERLRALADRRSFPAVDLSPAWYGPDAIHLRMRHWRSAWREVLSSWGTDTEPVPATRPPVPARLALRLLRPERWSLFGIQLGRPQPRFLAPDGTSVSLY